jgi:hypothetical protein
MLQAFKSLVVLLCFGGMSLWFGRLVLSPTHEEWAELKKYALVIGAVTTVALSSLGVWGYIVLGSWAVWHWGRTLHPAALLACLLFTVPYYLIHLGVGGVTLLDFRATDPLVAVCGYVAYQRNKTNVSHQKGGVPSVLLMVALWLAYQVLMVMLFTTVTNAAKSMISSWLSAYLVCYVFATSLSSRKDLRTLIQTFTVFSFFVAFVAIFESARHWLLYPVMERSLGIYSAAGGYLERGGVSLLRSQASTGHPIVLSGFLSLSMAFALVQARESLARLPLRYLGVFLIFLALVSTFSRGGWVGALVGLFAYQAFAGNAFFAMLRLIAAVVLLMGFLYLLPGGEKVMDLLPFVGQSERGSVDYRALLAEISYFVFMQNPWFGAPDYMEQPIMQVLVQGEGIVDMVNSYVGILLSSGVVGLAMFLGMFLPTTFSLMAGALRDQDPHKRMALACLISLMVLIATASFVNSLPSMCWMCIGIGFAVTKLKEPYLP